MYSSVSKLSKFLKAVVVLISAADAMIVLSSPWWLKIALDRGYAGLELFFGPAYHASQPGLNYDLLLLFILVCGFLSLGILFEAFRILTSIGRDNPFCTHNSASFRNAGIYSFAICVVFLIKMIASPSFLTLLCLGAFLLFGLFMVVLSQLFSIAAQIKEENELTI